MPVYSHRKFSSELAQVIQQASVLAREWQQDWLGAEHLFCALQAQVPHHTEAALGPLGIAGTTLARCLEQSFNTPSGRPVPQDHFPLTSRVQSALDYAESILFIEGRDCLECADVLRSLFSLESYFLMIHASDLIGEVDAGCLEPWQQRYLAYAQHLRADRWEFPAAQGPSVLRVLHDCGRVLGASVGMEMPMSEWNVKRWGRHAAVFTQCQHGVLRLQLTERYGGQSWWQRRWQRPLYQRLRNALAQIPGGRQGLPGAIFDQLPEAHYGSLNRAWFQGKLPTGQLRKLEPEDHAAGLDILQKLVALDLLPATSPAEMRACLEGEAKEFWVITPSAADLTVVAMAGILQRSPALAADVGSLVYNLTDPAYQRQGYWRTLVAVQLVKARQAGCAKIYLNTTLATRPLWEAVGVRFWNAFEVTYTGFNGGLVLTAEDADFLEAWLAAGSVAET